MTLESKAGPLTLALASWNGALDRTPSIAISNEHAVTALGYVAIEELKALRDIDDVLPPEMLDGGAFAESAFHSAPDPLRLPPPPFRDAGGDALFRALSSFVDRLESGAVPASSAAIDSEKKMGALLRSLHGFEAQIRARAQRDRWI